MQVSMIRRSHRPSDLTGFGKSVKFSCRKRLKRGIGLVLDQAQLMTGYDMSNKESHDPIAVPPVFGYLSKINSGRVSGMSAHST
jgi:hypothetical protein